MKSKFLIGIALALCTAACASSPGARFYMLNAIQETRTGRGPQPGEHLRGPRAGSGIS